ncbi:MAG: DNA primase [Oscillospiraceae bacterium]|nr:DNA primase [Oscillospiraceae bacterium]
MALPEGFLQELRDNNDIISVAQSYVELKHSGSTFSCRCPFHTEKTPSCHFYPQTQSFYCFGCGAGGDVVNFIRLIESLDYIEAVRFLAQRAGMPMPEDANDESAQKRRRLYEINREAGKYFYKKLFSPEGKAGLDYLLNRGLSLETIKRFGLGFAEDDYHKLHFYMKGLGFSDFELADAALLAQNNNKMYDKFRNRVMFPIVDLRGNIVGFGGRTLSEDKKTPKYLNSDETQVFKKRSMLFALNYAKNSKADYFILCEGYMDVISMHQAGFDSAVASLGTSFTSEQANLISRMGKKEVILSYDSDEAGQKAASRGINLFAEAGVNARVLKMDGAKDPDEYIKKFGADAFRALIEKSGSAIAYEMDKLANGLDLHNDDGKSAFIKKAVVFLAGINNPLDREVYISRAARLCDIPADTVRRAVDSQIRKNGFYAKKRETGELIHPNKKDTVNPDALKTPREEKAERGIICFLYHNPDKLELVEKRLSGGFATEFNKNVYEFLTKKLKMGLSPDISAFNEEFDSAQMGRITGIVNDAAFAFDEAALNDYIEVLNRFSEKKEQKQISEMTNDELLRFAASQKEKKK